MSERIKIFEAEYEISINGYPMINFYYSNWWIGSYMNGFFDVSINYCQDEYEPLIYDYLESVGLEVKQ